MGLLTDLLGDGNATSVVVSEAEPANPSSGMVWMQPALSYDIENAIAWDNLFFASRISGDEGDPVASWVDLASGFDAAQATPSKQPVLRKTAPLFGSRPAVQFDPLAQTHLQTPLWTPEDYPDTLVLVANIENQPGYFVDGDTGYRRRFGRLSGTWAAVANSTLQSGTVADGSPHLFVVTFNGASSTIEVDGVTVASGNTGTVQQVRRLTIGCRDTLDAFMQGHIALLGRAGLLTQLEKDDLLAWSRDYYGTP